MFYIFFARGRKYATSVVEEFLAVLVGVYGVGKIKGSILVRQFTGLKKKTD